MAKIEYVWKDRKRNFLGLPWSFTKYKLTKDRLFLEKGVLNTREDEVRLYRIISLTMTRSLWQKIIRTGTIHLDSTDQAMRNFDIRNVKNPADVKEQLSELIEISRKENRVYARENMMTGGPGSHDPGEFDHEENMDGYEGEGFDLDPDDINH